LLTPHDAFELADEPETGKDAREARGPRRRRMAPLTFPEPGHDGIHLPGPKGPEGFLVDPESPVD